MAHPTTWLDATQRARESQKVMNTQIKKAQFIPHLCPPTFLSHTPICKIISYEGGRIGQGCHMPQFAKTIL